MPKYNILFLFRFFGQFHIWTLELHFKSVHLCWNFARFLWLFLRRDFLVQKLHQLTFTYQINNKGIQFKPMYFRRFVGYVHSLRTKRNVAYNFQGHYITYPWYEWISSHCRNCSQMYNCGQSLAAFRAVSTCAIAYGWNLWSRWTCLSSARTVILGPASEKRFWQCCSWLLFVMYGQWVRKTNRRMLSLLQLNNEQNLPTFQTLPKCSRWFEDNEILP